MTEIYVGNLISRIGGVPNPPFGSMENVGNAETMAMKTQQSRRIKRQTGETGESRVQSQMNWQQLLRTVFIFMNRSYRMSGQRVIGRLEVVHQLVPCRSLFLIFSIQVMNFWKKMVLNNRNIWNSTSVAWQSARELVLVAVRKWILSTDFGHISSEIISIAPCTTNSVD